MYNKLRKYRTWLLFFLLSFVIATVFALGFFVPYGPDTVTGTAIFPEYLIPVFKAANPPPEDEFNDWWDNMAEVVKPEEFVAEWERDEFLVYLERSCNSVNCHYKLLGDQGQLRYLYTSGSVPVIIEGWDNLGFTHTGEVVNYTESGAIVSIRKQSLGHRLLFGFDFGVILGFLATGTLFGVIHLVRKYARGDKTVARS